MKNCPKCRVETSSDAEWCWHCGYAFEDREMTAPVGEESQTTSTSSGDSEPEQR